MRPGYYIVFGVILVVIAFVMSSYCGITLSNFHACDGIVSFYPLILFIIAINFFLGGILKSIIVSIPKKK